MFLRKSPYSLPPEQYGGGRKRIFIGLMLASCGVLGMLFYRRKKAAAGK